MNDFDFDLERHGRLLARLKKRYEKAARALGFEEHVGYFIAQDVSTVELVSTDSEHSTKPAVKLQFSRTGWHVEVAEINMPMHFGDYTTDAVKRFEYEVRRRIVQGPYPVSQ